MPEYLEITVDKFTFKVACDRLYTPEGVWVLPVETPEGVRLRLGVTDYVQQHSGDVAFVNVKRVGTVLAAGDEFTEIETMKVNAGLSSPVAGSVVEVNAALEMNPELVNHDPYEKGWLVVVQPSDWDTDRAGLLNANAYFDVMQAQIDEELKETS